MTDYEMLTSPGGIIPVNVETTGWLVSELLKLRAAIIRIDAINDNPACFNKEINDLCDPILRPHLNR